MPITKKLSADLQQRKDKISQAITKVGPTKLAIELGLKTTWAMYKWAGQGYVTNKYLIRFCELTKTSARTVCDPDISKAFKQLKHTTNGS